MSYVILIWRHHVWPESGCCYVMMMMMLVVVVPAWPLTGQTTPGHTPTETPRSRSHPGRLPVPQYILSTGAVKTWPVSQSVSRNEGGKMLKMINFLSWLYLFLTLIKAVTGKYLQPEYWEYLDFLLFPGEAVMTEFGCENETLLLHCPLLSEISIVRANYGRFSISVCNFRALDNIHTNCDSSHTTTDILKHRSGLVITQNFISKLAKLPGWAYNCMLFSWLKLFQV